MNPYRSPGERPIYVAPAPFRYRVRGTPFLSVLAAVGVALLGALAVAACFPESKRIAADASYAAQQMHCIDANDTRETIDACRDAVKRAWATDAGTDAAQDGAR